MLTIIVCCGPKKKNKWPNSERQSISQSIPNTAITDPVESKEDKISVYQSTISNTKESQSKTKASTPKMKESQSKNIEMQSKIKLRSKKIDIRLLAGPNEYPIKKGAQKINPSVRKE